MAALNTAATRVLQLHPTRRCNLSCLHCYSSSSPRERSAVDAALLRAAIRTSAELGYRIVSVSGGEPFLYPEIGQLTAEAKQCGMYATITTNGTLLHRERLHELRGCVDFLAISIDGDRATHNLLRASKDAFDTTLRGLADVRKANIPFGVVFTLTHDNWNQIENVVVLAIENGASIVQIHPLEMIGRAAERLPREEPDVTDCARAWLECVRLHSRYRTKIRLQLDLVSRDVMRLQGQEFAGVHDDSRLGRFGYVVSPLVIEADGHVVPIQYGFPSLYELGNLTDASLDELVAHWYGTKFEAFRTVWDATVERMHAPSDLPFFNWYAELQRAAEDHAAQRTRAVSIENQIPST